MRSWSPAWSKATCEDAGVAGSAAICSVCDRSRIRGDHNEAGDVFICARCQADASQLFAIQDSILDEAYLTADARRDSDECSVNRGRRGEP
jgi:hypothetical protein